MDGIIDQVRRMPLAEKRRLAEALRQAIAEELASGGGRARPLPEVRLSRLREEGRDAAGRQRWLCRGVRPDLRRRHARAARPLEAARGRVDGVRGLHGRRAAAARDGGQGGGVAVHGVVHEDARLRGDGGAACCRRAGSPSRWTARTSRSRCRATTPAAGSAWGGPPTGPATTPPAPGLGGSVCVLCGVSETGDCFCELADGAEDGPGVALVALRRLPAACSVATDGRRSYAGSLGGRPHEVRPSRELEMVNSLHSRLKAFIGRFNGVSNRQPPALPRLVLLARAVPAQRPRPPRAAVRPRGVGDLRVHARADAPGVASLPEPGQPRQHRGRGTAICSMVV